jgi:photosystem II stability/assembly factor-like uncharacterized protein
MQTVEIRKPKHWVWLLAAAFVLAMLRSPSAISQAEENVWRSLGPDGGTVNVVAVSHAAPAAIYAGTEGGGIFKSNDGGASWRLTSLRNRIVHSIAIDPSDPSVIYAGTVFGLFRSGDGGDNWTSLSAPTFANTAVQSVVVDPTSGATIYAGTDDGVLKSIDGGAAWSPMNTGLLSLRIRTLEIDSSQPATVYAGTEDGLFKSVNGGASWSDAGLGPGTVLDLAVSPVNSDRVYVAAGGLLWSANAGLTWNSTSVSSCETVVVDSTDPNVVYAGGSGGVFRSTDAGVSWVQVTSGLTDVKVQSLAVDPNGQGVVYVGSFNAGVLKTSSGGGNWSESNHGLTAADIFAVAVDPSDPRTIYCGVFNRGVYKSGDSGATWTLKLKTQTPQSLAIDPSDSNIVYVGIPSFGPMKSTDGGDTWTLIPDGLFVPPGPPRIMVNALAMDPARPRTLFIGTRNGLYKTANGGREWGQSSSVTVTPNSADIISVAVAPSDSNVVYAAPQNVTLYRSSDGGETWTRPAGTFTGAHSISVDPLNPNIVYLGTSAFALKSTNGAASWSILSITPGLPLTGVTNIVPARANSNIVYAGSGAAGVFRSADQGTIWTPLTAGLTNSNIRTLAVDTADPNSVYAGTAAGGLFSIKLRIPPRITGASIEGKHLVIVGEEFARGAVILVDGAPQKTKAGDDSNALVGKKLAKRLPRGQSVTLQIRNPDGTLSAGFPFMRPAL